MSDCLFVHHVCLRRSEALSFCSVREENNPTGQQTPKPISTVVGSWSYTGKKMFSQQWREKHASVV